MERQRLSYQEDPLSDEGLIPDGPATKAGGGGALETATSLQAWRGDSLAVDVRRGVVPAAAVPPVPASPRLGGSLSSRDVAIGLGEPSLCHDSKHRQRSCASNRLLQHTRIQLWKNYISAKRHPGLTVMQMLSFALFVVFLFVLQQMGKSRLMAEELHPPVVKLGGVPRCKAFNGAPCTTLIYTPAGHPEVDFIMNELAREQGLTMGEDIKPVATVGEGNWTQYWLDHPNQTLAAVSFLDRSAEVDWAATCANQTVSDTSDVYPTGDCALPDIIRYRVYYNDTTRYSRASRTYTPFYPLDVTREVQRSLDEAILTLRGRHAGYKNCEETVINVGTSAAGNTSVVVRIPPNEVYSSARLQCSPGNNCAYDSPDLEGETAPAETVSTAHLDPTGEGPDDWYLLQGAQDELQASFFVGRYDSPDNPGWGYRHLQLVVEFCRPDWRANLTVYTKSMPVVGDARVEMMLAESVFLGFGVMFFYCGAVFNYFLLLLAIVREKEHRLRTAMLMMGLSRGSCWASWLIYSMVINSFSSAFCILAGYICGFQYFHHSNPVIVFLTFWMFSLAMTAFSFFASAIVQTERVAVVIGFLLFVVGSFFQVIVGAGTVYFYEPDMDPIYRRTFSGQYISPLSLARARSLARSVQPVCLPACLLYVHSGISPIELSISIYQKAYAIWSRHFLSLSAVQLCKSLHRYRLFDRRAVVSGNAQRRRLILLWMGPPHHRGVSPFRQSVLPADELPRVRYCGMVPGLHPDIRRRQVAAVLFPLAAVVLVPFNEEKVQHIGWRPELCRPGGPGQFGRGGFEPDAWQRDGTGDSYPRS